MKEIVLNDYQAELAAVEAYNGGVCLAREVKDDGTRDLLTRILKDEEEHVDWAEEQKDQIEQMGIENYLTNQVGKVK